MAKLRENSRTTRLARSLLGTSTMNERLEAWNGIACMVVALAVTACGSDDTSGAGGSSSGTGGSGASSTGGSGTGGSAGSSSGGTGGIGTGGSGGTGVGGAGATSSYGSTDAIYDAAYDGAMGSLADARWVATDGSDSGAGTESDPYATLEQALSEISGGGAIIVKDGTYSVGENGWLNDYTGGSIPSGSPGAYTIVKAQNRFGVRLVQNAADYYGSVVLLQDAEYVWVDGFVIEKATASTPYAVDLGSENRLTRTIIVQKECDEYGGAVAFGSNDVIEDVHAYGWGRYVFFGGTGGGSSPSGSSVIRRSVSHLAGGPVGQPTASFAFYGSNDGDYAQVKDMLYANAYELDSPALETGSDDATKWGSWYHAKSVRNVLHHGCGIVNGGAHYGGFRTDNYGDSSVDMAEYENSFVAGLTDAPAFSMSSGHGINDGSNVSVCNVPGGTEGGGISLTNVLTSPVHPVQRVGADGAEQLHAVGAFLSRFDDANSTTVQTNLPLWPFPYESFIQKEFGTALDKPGGYYPTGATQTDDPFAGTALDGQPNTFTRRVWEACGTATPDFTTIY